MSQSLYYTTIVKLTNMFPFFVAVINVGEVPSLLSFYQDSSLKRVKKCHDLHDYHTYSCVLATRTLCTYYAPPVPF